jgi:hypothetical protein
MALCLLCPRLLRVRVLFASCIQFSGLTLVCKAAEEEMNGSTAESDVGYLGSMSIPGAAQWVKLSESWTKFKYFNFHKMFKNLVEGQKKVPRVKKIYVFEHLGWICFQYRQTTQRC